MTKKQPDFKKTEQLIQRYKKADEEYWKSMYYLEQFIKREFLDDKESGDAEVINDYLEIHFTVLTEQLKQLKEKLIELEIPFNMDKKENNDGFVLYFGLYDVEILSEK